MASHETVVFLGPTVSIDRARAILDADYRPPARMGDVYGILGTGVRTVALIDGVFHREPSVWPREILAALLAGIRVVGASSMGALRAAELRSYGMEGHGTVFAWYRDGRIEGDDEVALSHGSAEDGFRALSEPLVNIRHAVDRAVDAGVIDALLAERLVESARRAHYPNRSLRRLLADFAWTDADAGRRTALESFFAAGDFDLKRDDAVGLLRALAAPTPAPRPAPTRTPVPERQYYRRIKLAHRVIAGVRGEALLRCIEDSPELLSEQRATLARGWFLRSWAHRTGERCPPEVLSAARDAWVERHGITDLSRWLIDNALVEAELWEQVHHHALEQWLLDRGGGDPASYLTEWATLEGVVPEQVAPADVPRWLIERGPDSFGYDWDLPLESFTLLQVTGRIGDVVRRLAP